MNSATHSDTRTPLKTIWLLVATALTLLINHQTFASKDFYKWEDENGTIHYSGQPPRDKEEATVVRTTNIHGTEPSNTNSANNKPDTPKKAVASTQARTKSPERCQWAKKTLQILQESPRIRIHEEGAEDSRLITQEEQAERKKEAQKAITDHC